MRAGGRTRACWLPPGPVVPVGLVRPARPGPVAPVLAAVRRVGPVLPALPLARESLRPVRADAGRAAWVLASVSSSAAPAGSAGGFLAGMAPRNPNASATPLPTAASVQMA